MLRALFVDDEPNVLSGLRRMLRGQRDDWEFAFVGGAAEALELLARRRFEVIITDLRMPGMDGAELLGEVRRRHPHMVRVVFSGHVDRDSTLKSVRPAHQYLAKPCERESLLALLRRAARLSECLANQSLAALVAGVEVLPSLPDQYARLLAELTSQTASLESVGQIIGRDVGMTATLLKTINSAFFGLPRIVQTPTDAVRLLGLELVGSLVVGSRIFESFDLARFPDFSLPHLWEHSLAVAGWARLVDDLEGLGKLQVDQCHLAGMLHDVGKLVLAWLTPNSYREVLAKVKRENRPVVGVEQEVLGTTHARRGLLRGTVGGAGPGGRRHRLPS